MTVPSETIFKIRCAVEALVISNGSALDRAQRALPSLTGIKASEFRDDLTLVYWSFISSASKDIKSGKAASGVSEKFISSIWQLFEAYSKR